MKLLLAIALTASTIAIGGTSASALPPCRDSNGTAPGGSVYLYYGPNLYCNVTPPQRLHLLHTPSAAACAQVGGHGWTGNRICWDADY